MSTTDRLTSILKNTFVDFTQMSEFVKSPLIFEKADGLYYWDRDGKRYFDAIGGVFVSVLGHRPRAVIAAVQEQLARLDFAPPLHGMADVNVRFIESLAAVTPGNLNYIKSFSGGSESIEAAIKFSRQYYKQTGKPDKYKVIGNYLSYHGATFAAMAASGGSKRKIKFEPQMPGFLKNFSPIQLRDRFPSWADVNRFCAELFDEIIASENPDTVAAVLLEPICNTGGMVTYTDEYLRIVRDICTRRNVMLIFDEVLTGFGRTGDFFAAQTYGVTPDIICSGKGLACGVFPMGAMIAREDLGQAFWGSVEEEVQFAHGHSFASHPVACAAAIATIRELVEKDLPRKARRLGDRLRGNLEKMKSLGCIREIRGKGVLLGIELVKDAATNRPYDAGKKLGDALKKTALENGLIMRIDPDWFAVSPPLIAEEADIDEMCALIEKSLRDALRRVG